MPHRLILVSSLLLLAPSLAACELLDQPCPEGEWRPRAMEACERVPTFDGGVGVDAATDAATDAGASDAAVGADGGTDGAVGTDAGTDAGVADSG